MRVRTLHLVRHGQYDRDPERLTELGRTQAAALARHLARSDIASLTSSTMPRAKETAQIMSEDLPDARRAATHCLRENGGCEAPRFIEPPAWLQGQRDAHRERQAQLLERAWERFIKPPRARERHDVLVCHGNMIRLLVCRAMQLPPGVWWELVCPFHCSLTTLLVRPDMVRLLRYNDVGHLPEALRTLE